MLIRVFKQKYLSMFKSEMLVYWFKKFCY